MALVAEGLLDRSTLEEGKVSIVEGSRQKMQKVSVEHHAKSTHWLNPREIAKSMGVTEWAMLEWFSKNFTEMKICWSEASLRVIFPGKELFLQNCVVDFAKEYSKKHKLDLTHWNQ